MVKSIAELKAEKAEKPFWKPKKDCCKNGKLRLRKQVYWCVHCGKEYTIGDIIKESIAKSEAKIKRMEHNFWYLQSKISENDKEIAELKEALKFNEKARDIDFAEIERLKKENEDLFQTIGRYNWNENEIREQSLSDLKSQLREKIEHMEIDNSIPAIATWKKVLELLEEKT